MSSRGIIFVKSLARIDNQSFYDHEKWVFVFVMVNNGCFYLRLHLSASVPCTTLKVIIILNESHNMLIHQIVKKRKDRNKMFLPFF